MTEQTLRRSNWPVLETAPRRNQAAEPAPSRDDEDPLAELARIVARGDPFLEASSRNADSARREPNFDQDLSNDSTLVPFPGRRREPDMPAMPMPADVFEPAVAADVEQDPFADMDAAAFEVALRGTIEPEVGADSAPEAPPPPLPNIADGPPAPTLEALDDQFMRAFDRELFGPADVDASAAVLPPLVSDAAPSSAAAEAVPDVEPAPSAPAPRSGGLMTVAAVIGLVVVGAGGAVGYSMLTGGARTASGEPPIVRADGRVNRVAAEPQPETQAQAQNKLIFDRVGSERQAPANERIVPREEQPVAALPQAAPAAPRVVVPNPVQSAANNEPRRVTTTTIRVRPDGSLETEPTRAAAPPPAQPAAIPPSAAPAAVVAAAPPTQAAVPTPPAVQPPAAAPVAPVVAAARDAAPATPPARQILAVPPARPTPPAPRETAAPAPADPPASQLLARRPATEPARVAEAPRTTPPATPNRTNGVFVQVSSQRTEAAARSSYADLQRRFPDLLGSRAVNIRSADLGDRGTFYRARVGGFSTREEAAQFCTRLRQAGGDCVIATN